MSHRVSFLFQQRSNPRSEPLHGHPSKCHLNLYHSQPKGSLFSLHCTLLSIMRATRDRLCTFVVRAAEYKFGFKKKKKKLGK